MPIKKTGIIILEALCHSYYLLSIKEQSVNVCEKEVRTHNNRLTQFKKKTQEKEHIQL